MQTNIQYADHLSIFLKIQVMILPQKTIMFDFDILQLVGGFPISTNNSNNNSYVKFQIVIGFSSSTNNY